MNIQRGVFRLFWVLWVPYTALFVINLWDAPTWRNLWILLAGQIAWSVIGNAVLWVIRGFSKD
jgi:hypothetical protein